MAVSDDDLRGWLGPHYTLADEIMVRKQDWQDPRWRAQFLCQQVRLGLFHVHDETNTHVVVKFAEKKLD